MSKPLKVETTKIQLTMPTYQINAFRDLAGRTKRPMGSLCGDIAQAFRAHLLKVKDFYGLPYRHDHDREVTEMVLMKLSGIVNEGQFHVFMERLRPQRRKSNGD